MAAGALMIILLYSLLCSLFIIINCQWCNITSGLSNYRQDVLIHWSVTTCRKLITIGLIRHRANNDHVVSNSASSTHNNSVLIKSTLDNLIRSQYCVANLIRQNRPSSKIHNTIIYNYRLTQLSCTGHS